MLFTQNTKNREEKHKRHNNDSNVVIENTFHNRIKIRPIQYTTILLLSLVVTDHISK